METFALAGLECLPTKKFALYVARMAGRATTFRLGLRVIVRQLRVGVDYEAICVSDVTIEPLHRRHLRAALDGELEGLESPMRIRVAPHELLVMSPREQKPG
jgi:diacylglycerol kinase family enzyme